MFNKLQKFSELKKFISNLLPNKLRLSKSKVFVFFIIIAIIFAIGNVLAQSILMKSDVKIKDSNFYLSLGNFLLKNGFEEHALTAYKKAFEIEPENKFLLNNLGFYFKEKNPLLAEDYFKKALDVDPNYETARNNLALLYNKLGKYDLAAEQLYYLVEKTTDKNNENYLKYNYDLAINLANKYYYQSKDYNDLINALKYFKIVYEKDKSFQHVLENIKVLEEIRRMY